MEIKGTVFNIQPFSIYDGPGIRTTVFLKGCNLRCVWCHNPESYLPGRQLQIHPEKCIGCGNCFNMCPQQAHYITEQGEHKIHRDKCTACGICADNCYSDALAMTGRMESARAVFETILRDKPYFDNSGGGVTFSGGECLVQPIFLMELLRLCHEEGIHTAVDTAGNVPFSVIEPMLPYIDLFLYDVKAADPQVHKALTGVTNEQIISNLRRLSELGKEIIVRIPYVPGANDKEIEGIAELLSGLKLRDVEVLPYHKLGEGKRTALDMEMQKFTVPSNADLEEACGILRSKGVAAHFSVIK
ncbi:MAG TPA: glycyl-radical enzyme activating protein [Candidatus Gallacutalibacter stercoravium]|nr:glycyl-radical enzyme activating protein [Candidatus Gallacutalibacter stercoravium]